MKTAPQVVPDASPEQEMAERIAELKHLLSMLGRRNSPQAEQTSHPAALHPEPASAARVPSPAKAMPRAEAESAPFPSAEERQISSKDGMKTDEAIMRHDRLQAYDDAMILPSRRGQYR